MRDAQTTMIQLLDAPIVSEEAPLLDIALPRVERRPSPPVFYLKKPHVQKIIAQACAAYQAGNGPGFGQAYGQLVALFQPWIRWGLSCWEYLLSTEGCRFVPRSLEEKRYCRGDYRVFGENDFQSFVHRAFKERLLDDAHPAGSGDFGWQLRKKLWPTILTNSRELAHPADARQRLLTAYSYLRCTPYQFLNSYHHQRVMATVKQLASPHRQVIDLYYLQFYREEAVLETAGVNQIAFRRRQMGALRAIAAWDYLSCVLLMQIERY